MTDKPKLYTQTYSAADVEELSAVLHGIYQQEARRQADRGEDTVRHPNDYNDLPEHTKEYDRVLARYILQTYHTQQEMDDVLEWKNGFIDQLSREVSSLRAVADRALGNYDAVRTVLRAVEKERDAARALADQLSNAIAKVMPDEPESYRTESYEEWMDTWQRCARALAAHDCRDWKPAISPPGSGLDGLQADIDRTDA